MVCASTRSIDIGKSRLSSGIRVAVTTTEVSSAAASPCAVGDTPISHESAAINRVAARPRMINDNLPHAGLLMDRIFAHLCRNIEQSTSHLVQLRLTFQDRANA